MMMFTQPYLFGWDFVLVLAAVTAESPQMQMGKGI